ALGKASLPERHGTPWRPLEVNYPAAAGFHDENGDPNAGRWLGLSRATVHAQGGPTVSSWLGCSRQSQQGEVRRPQDLADVVAAHDRRCFIEDIYDKSTPTPVTNHRHTSR